MFHLREEMHLARLAPVKEIFVTCLGIQPYLGNIHPDFFFLRARIV